MDAIITAPAPAAERKPLTTVGLIRLCVENVMQFARGTRSQLGLPRYKIVQSVAAQIGSNSDVTPSAEVLAELELTLSTCLQFVREARAKRLGPREQSHQREEACS